MKNIKIYIIALGFLFPAFLSAQDYATALKGPGVLHHYYLDPILINPAYTGFTGQHRLLFNYRDQWADFRDAPRSFTFSYNGALGRSIGLGAMLFSDQFGVENRLRGQLSYAYRFESESAKFGIGLSTEYMRYYLDNAALTDPNVTIPDDRISQGIDGFEYFLASLGMYAEIEDQFIIGLSFPSLIQSRQDNNGGTEEEEREFSYIGYLGYRAPIDEYDMIIEPILCIRKVGDIDLQIDANLKLSFLDERLFSGVTYGFGATNRLGFLLGARVSALDVFYSYDMTLRDFQDYNTGSHEISVRINIPGASKPMAKEGAKPMER